MKTQDIMTIVVIVVCSFILAMAFAPLTIIDYHVERMAKAPDVVWYEVRQGISLREDVTIFTTADSLRAVALCDDLKRSKT